MTDDDMAAHHQQELEARQYNEDQLLKQARLYSGFRAECDRFSADFKRKQQELEHERYQFTFIRPTRTEHEQVPQQG
jgi:hypothetical protein